MELGEDGSFDLRGFSPHSLTFLPRINCLLATEKSGGARCLDLTSGTELLSTELLPTPVLGDEPSPPLLCTVHPSTSKLVVAQGRKLGVRGPIGAVVLLRTVLQSPASSPTDEVCIEILMDQVTALVQELRNLSLTIKSGQLAPVLKQLDDGMLAQRTGKFTEKSSKWTTLSFQGPVQQLSELFEEILTKLKPANSRTTGATPSTPPSPALPVVSAIHMRLLLLRPDHAHLVRFEEGAEATANESKLMYCEAIRRLSLSKWPHKDYVWAVPKTMASAGFYHMCNPPMHNSLTVKGDKVSCFACRVYLYSWEPTDEPWSEHERHAMQCPFMRGEHTENIPAAVTEGSHPARVCAGTGDRVVCVSTAANCGLLATATGRGHITIWDLDRCLYFMEHAKLEVTEKLLSRCSNIREYRFSRLRRERRWAFREWELWEEEEMLLAERELRAMEAEASESSEPSVKQSFHVTALTLVAYPDYFGLSSSRQNSSPILVTGVTLEKEGKAVPLLLMHNIKIRKLPEKPKPEPSKPTPAHPPEDPLMDYWIDPLDPLPPPPVLPVPVGVVSSGPPSAPPSNMLDVLSDSKGGTSSVPLPAFTRFMYGVPLNEFSCSREGLLPEIQHILPLDGGRQLAVSVSCCGRGTEAVNDSRDPPRGGLLLYRVFSYSKGVTDVEIDYPVRMVRFSSEKDTIVSMCVLEDAMLERGSGKYSYTTDVIATVKRGGEVVLYEIKRLNEVARYSPREGEEAYVSCAYCAQSGHLAVTTRGGRVVLLQARRTLTQEEKEVESPQAVNESYILSQPLTLEDLNQFTALTKTSPEGVAFTGSAPYEWQEISFLQHHRRSPIHMHLPQDVGRATNIRIWQYKPPPTNTSNTLQLENKSQHLFELFPTPKSSLSLVSIKFMFANPQCLSDEASVSLLLPRWDQSEGGTTDVPKPGEPSNAELICGPVRLKPLVDITGQSAQVSFCHPRLMTSKLTVLWLLTENLFSTEHENTARSGDSAAPPFPALRRGGSWHTRAFRHHIHRPSDSTSKTKSIPEHSTISVTLYSLANANRHRGDNADDKLDLLLKLINRSEFVTLVTMAACGYRVESNEYKILPASLQTAVECEQGDGVEGDRGNGVEGEQSGGEQSGGVEEDEQFKAMELLCWMAAMHGCRAEREGMMLGAVSQLMTSLLHACFIRGNRMLSHKCARLLVSLYRSEDDLGEDQFHSTLTSSLSTLLPLLPLTRSAASVHWFLRLVATVGGSCDGHMTSTLCLTLLVELTKHLSTKSSLPAQLLQTHFQQEGSIFEPELYDIYLSYCQKATSKPQQKASLLHTNFASFHPPEIQVPLFPPGFSDVPPTSSSTSSSSSSSYRVVDRRVHTIYDSELQLLLDCSSKTESEAYKSISEFTTFKHGSFLLYGQRGLLETQPLEYSCVSVSGNATVQELASQPAAAAAEETTSASPMAEPTKTSGYHFPKPGGRKQGRPKGTVPSQPIPPILADIMVLPKELVMQIDALKSGVAYSVVLRFPQPIVLTDISVPSAGCMSSVSVDVWLEKDEEGKTVRVAHSSEIKDKSIAIGNLMPPPLCQFAKVTFIGRLGASREKVQVFLGSFFGQPVFGPESPLPSALLHSLEEMLLGQYLTARDRLTSALMAYADVARKRDSTSNATLLKQCESGVSSRYQNCFKAQVRLARLRNFIRTQAGGTTGSEKGPSRGVFKVDEELQKLDLSELASNRLYKLVGCLVDALLVLNDHGETETAQTGETGPDELPRLASLESCQQLPTLTEGECSLLFTTLCVHGVPKLHARPCAILIRLCGSQPWWGRFITSAALQLFSSSQTAVFNRERTLLQLSALCQRTYRCSNVMRCLFQLLEEKLSPLLQDVECTDQARCPDHLLLQWLVLLLSHILASLSLPTQSQNRSNLFVPVLSLPVMEPGQGEGVEGEGGVAVDSRVELGEMRREMKRRLAELQHQMKMLVGEEKMALRHEYEVIIQDYRTQRKQLYSQQQRRAQGVAAMREPKPPPPPPHKDARPVEPDPVLVSLPRQLCVNVARGLMLYMLTLTGSQSWDLIPVACKSLSQLVSLSGHRITLRSLVSQEQLDQLLGFCCQRTYGGSSRGSEGSLEWGQRALQCLLINALYHGEIAPYLKVLAETEAAEEEAKEEKRDNFKSSTIPYKEFQVVPEMETDTQDEEDSALTNDKPLPSETNITSIDVAVAQDEASQILEMSEEKESVLVPTELLKPGGESEAALPSKKEEPSSDSPAMTEAVQEKLQAEVTEIFKPLPLEPDYPDLPSHPVVVHKLKDTFSTLQQLKKAATHNEVKVVLKKLSKHSLAGMKYAPGDYSGIPVYRKSVERVREIDPQLPYQTFIISNTVEHRLQFTVEFPTEVELQGLAKKVYESVLLALLHAQPGLPPPSDTLEDLSGADRVEEEGTDPGSISVSTAMLCQAIEKLLEKAAVSQSDVDVVAVLELWNVLNSLLPASTDHKLRKPSARKQPPSSETTPDNSQAASEMKEEDYHSSTAGLPIYSHRALNLLLDNLLTPSPPPSAKMWQLAVSLLLTALRHMWTTVCVWGRSVDIDESKLLKVLVRLFSSTSDASGFQGAVVNAMLSELAPMQLAGSSEKRGVHLLLEVMVILLESCTTSLSPLASPLLLHLINVSVSHVRLLWGDSPSPSLCRNVTCLLRRLTSAIVALLPNILEDPQQPGVVLYGSELEEDRRRYRYITGATQEVKWAPLLSAQSSTNKAASELLQLLRQLLSFQLPDSAHLPLREFCQNEFGSESQRERDFLKLSNPLMPLLSLVYADSRLLTMLLKLLNSTHPDDDRLQSYPSKVGGTPLSLVQNLFCNFVRFLDAHCKDHSCFFTPILQVLAHKQCRQGEKPVSRALMNLIGNLTSEFEKQEELGQLHGFIHDGGARLIFDFLMMGCKHLSSLSGDVMMQSVSKLGQKETPKPFRENSHLINFLPSATIQLSPSRTSVRDLQFSGLSDHPSRSSTFHHTFHSHEEWLKISLSLPHPILLHAIQLYQPLGLMQNGPSAILVECASQSGLASTAPVTPLLQTSGLSCIKVELQNPVVAQDVVIHLRRPLVMDGLSLSHMYLLGVGYGGTSSTALPKQERTHPSAGWLYMIDQWLGLSDAIQRELMIVATATPDLLPSCLSLLHSQETLGFQSSNQLERLLVAMATHSPEHGLTIVKHLLGFSFKEPAVPGGWQPAVPGGWQAPVSTTVALDLLHSLCLPCSEDGKQRLLLALRLLSNLPSSPEQLLLSHHLPLLIRTLSSTMWQGKEEGECVVVEEEVFRSLVELAFSQDVGSQLKLALNSLACSIGHCHPELFPLILTNCQQAVEDEHPNVGNLLHTLAQVAKSPHCSKTLLKSDLVSKLVKDLHDGFSELLKLVREPSEEEVVLRIRFILSKGCQYVAFFSDICGQWTPAKDWIGTPENASFWPLLVEFLSRDISGLLSSVELSFCQQVVCEFFEACICGHTHNKVLLTRLLCNAVRGNYTLPSDAPSPSEDGMNQMTPPCEESESSKDDIAPLSGKSEDTLDDKILPVLTPFLYKLMVDLILKSQPLSLVLKEQREETPKGLSLTPPPPPLSLPPTHEALHFHPSFPIGRGSYCLHLPSTYTLEDLARLCQSQQQQVQPASSETRTLGKKPLPSEPPGNNFDIAKFKLRGWKLPHSKASATRSTEDVKVAFADPSRPDILIPLEVELSRLARLSSAPTSSLTLLLKHHEFYMNLEIQEWLVLPKDGYDPSLLELFIQHGGLQPLAECVPSLYPFLWPDRLSGRIVPDPAPPHISGFKSHYLLQVSTSLPFHSIVMLTLGLRLCCYGNAMGENLPVSFVLLRLLLGVELNDPVPRLMLEQLAFLPYLVLLETLKQHPPSKKEGWELRQQALEVGVLHHTLHCLSSSGHHSPRIEERDDTNGTKPVGEQSFRKHSQVTSSADKQYWAKGTGFGTGSTTSAWNMEAMLAKQKSEEKYVTLCFTILSEFLAVSKEHPQPVYCGPEVMSLLSASCLLPALAAYLLNDSILDISKHVELYQSVLDLLSSLAVNPSLRPLLLLPVFSDGDSGSSDSTSLATLTSKLRDITATYQKTAKLKPTELKPKQKPPPPPPPSPPPPLPTPPPLSSSTDAPPPPPPPPPPPLPQQSKRPTSSSLNSPSDEADLAELVANILSTSEKVAAMVQELERGREGRRRDPTSPQEPLDSSFDAYMKTMKPLQFDTHLFTEEDDDTRRITFHTPFHYEAHIRNASFALMYSIPRAHRLAREVTSISSSLPLSPSSSVFVRCDIERLDVMKVLITGPSETPYANGCFEFDVFFPQDYPKSPMMVNLMTTGHGRVRFNPNLYNDGKVCLSILNTWHGRPEEKWNSQTSSFLQVLVSIQSLILVPEPYFNEPGYEQYRGTPYGNQKSLAYNATIYVATVQWAMINQIRNPSPCFKEVILRHFYMRHTEVLSQCERWKQELAEGIQSMQEAGVTVTLLKELLRSLVKSVDTLRVELEKIKPSDFAKKTDEELGYANDELPISIT